MPFHRTSSMLLIALLVLAGCTSGDVTPEDELVDEPVPGDEEAVTDPPPGETAETDVEGLPVEGTVAAPPPLGKEEGSDAADTPEGRAELELLVDPVTGGPDGQVELRLVNRGEVPLWHGWHAKLQRWTGAEWVDAPWPDEYDADVLESLLPGDETHPRRFPGEDAALDPGWYRVVWEARWQDDTGENEPVELRARASFEVSSPPSPEDLPEWYAEREPMPSCGAFEPDEIALDNVELEEANRCLLEAFDNGEPAELQVVLRTEEGDPIVETYRVIAAGELERMVDSRRDDFGNKDFYYAVCTDLYEDRPRGGPTVRVADCVYDEDRTVTSDG